VESQKIEPRELVVGVGRLIEVVDHGNGAALFAMTPHRPSTFGTRRTGKAKFRYLRAARPDERNFKKRDEWVSERYDR
jgi:hypothetical protein